MALSNADYQQLIIDETNTGDDTKVATNIALWWDMYSFKNTTHLQYLWAKRKVIEYLQGKKSDRIDSIIVFEEFKENQEFTNIGDMLQAVEDEIERIEGKPIRKPGKVSTTISVNDNTVKDNNGNITADCCRQE